MKKVILSITMSLDGFIAGPNVSKETPLGVNGLSLHHWIFGGKQKADGDTLSDLVDNCGAVITGSKTYKTAIDGAWEGESPFNVPAFILSSKPIDAVKGFDVVTDGIESALSKAKKVAGDKNVWIMGGANVAQQYFYSNLLDEFHLHIAPVILGSGTPLFKSDSAQNVNLKKESTIETPAATHLFFSVGDPK
ncbi:dihydrofolate reductase [Pedobacter sp. HMF7647]|uniref:Dihydrofolate reductase n=1 Tax=Hufsiella arboris TaxID=2695275 RepID=A0A7K1YCZ6_9SPHI|nr:dihydrofolate reductase family protein [Hufsiella arboris]MXV51918.1 dihydrofolate reductase [Hufsiella arboris]